MNGRRTFLALSLLVLPGLAAAQPSPPGLSALPRGGWRLAFAPGEASLPAGAMASLAELGRRLAATPAGFGRVTVEAQASAPAGDPSAARRLSLARAVAVRQALVAGGLEETRVDVRPLGRTAAAIDTADILPPEAPRAGADPSRTEAPRAGADPSHTEAPRAGADAPHTEAPRAGADPSHTAAPRSGQAR